MRLLSILLLALGTGLPSAASATTFFDIDALGGVKLSSGGNSSLAGSFDITAEGIEGDSFRLWFPYSLYPITVEDRGGFEVGTHRTVGASVLLAVRDDFDLRLEYMLLELGSTQLAGPVEVDFGIEAFDVSATLFATIDATGQLAYEIIARRGDFRVDYAALYVEAVQVAGAPSAAPVSPMPEVGSLAAYAVGTLLVAGGIRRRRLS